MGLFGTNKPNTTLVNHKDEYYKNYYFNEKVCNGIEFVSYYEKCSKKQAAELLMKAGLSSWMGGKVKEYIEADRIAREKDEKMKRTRFVYLLRKYAREKGLDI